MFVMCYFTSACAKMVTMYKINIDLPFGINILDDWTLLKKFCTAQIMTWIKVGLNPYLI